MPKSKSVDSHTELSSFQLGALSQLISDSVENIEVSKFKPRSPRSIPVAPKLLAMSFKAPSLKTDS